MLKILIELYELKITNLYTKKHILSSKIYDNNEDGKEERRIDGLDFATYEGRIMQLSETIADLNRIMNNFIR